MLDFVEDNTSLGMWKVFSLIFEEGPLQRETSKLSIGVDPVISQQGAEILAL